ncbi:DNA-binding transcriptional regulator, XRE-family HTH domain [Microbacterium sp. ru370.1]|uniref:helix-turn-helix domain-containing protein n=1 Tax=unclassified Microbacterium TaxID=2609290 RepID=UPI0008838AEC|nr:DNA-binding transcriptional regulator, XRE-family HTH domain [Microbacterium sp. ru370.1]SIT81759.1 DNA-binding transcriptional regulator, XRE-family HTH domain [Microbacterium sp. RU1D]
MTPAALDGHLNHVLRTLAASVRRLREERGLTALALAFEAGLSESRVRAIEAGRTTASLATLVALAETFDVEIGALFGEARARHEPTPEPSHSSFVVPSEVVWGGELPPAPWLSAATPTPAVSPYVVPSDVVWGGELPAAPWTSARAARHMPEPLREPALVALRRSSPTGAASQAVVRATEVTWGGELPPAPWSTPSSPDAVVPTPVEPTLPAAPRGEGHPHRHPVDAASSYVMASSGSAMSRRPRTFSDLREGALAGREFASLREFAIAAVMEGRFSAVAVAGVFRLPSWRLEQWVAEARQVRR